MKNNLDTPVAKQCRALYTKMSVMSYTDIRTAHRERKKIERTSPASWAGKNMSKS